MWYLLADWIRWTFLKKAAGDPLPFIVLLIFFCLVNMPAENYPLTVSRPTP